MKTVKFIYKGGSFDLAFLYKTENGYLFEVNIDRLSREYTQFLSFIETEIISIVPGDNELIEVTSTGHEMLRAYYSIRRQSDQIFMEKDKTTSGNDYYRFHF